MADLQRILAGTAATIRVKFEQGGEPASPDGDVIVNVTRDSDGELIVDNATADGGAGEFSYTFASDDVAELDLLDARWTASISGAESTLQTRVEIVGGFTFRLSELRTSEPTLADVLAYPAEALADARTQAEQALEDRNGGIGWAMVPRYRRDRVPVDGVRHLGLAPLVRRVRGATIGQVDIPGLEVVQGAVPFDGWFGDPQHPSEISIGYEHGADEVPARGKRAAMRLAKHYLLPSPLDDRAIRIDTDASTYTVSTPGLRGQSFGIPEVDSFVNDYAVGCTGFASVRVVAA